MGSGASKKRQGVLFISHESKVHRLVFDRATTARDLQEQLAVSVGLNRLSNVVLKTKSDSVIAVSPTMPSNTSRSVEAFPSKLNEYYYVYVLESYNPGNSIL